MLLIVFDGKRAGDRRHAPAHTDAQLAENLDAAPAAIERVRPDVEMKTVLRLRPCASAEVVRLLKQPDALALPCNECGGGQPRHAAADNDGIVRFI